MTVLTIGMKGQLATALSKSSRWQFVGRDEANLAEPGEVAQVIARVRPAWVVNTAAYTAVDRAESEPALAERMNAQAVGEIATAAAEARAAFLHISTDYVFDGTKIGPWSETDPASPLNVYGCTKLAGERLALAANPRTVILRTSWLYSPWGNNFVRTMLRLAAERRRIRVVHDQRGNPTSALDLARVCLHVVQTMSTMEAHDVRWGLYHYAGAGIASWADFAKAIFAYAVSSQLIKQAPQIDGISAVEYPTLARRPTNSTLDCSKFQRFFGIAPRPWRDALVETLDHMSSEIAE